MNLERLSNAGDTGAADILSHKNLAYSMKAKDYSHKDTNGQGLDLRSEEQIRRGKTYQTPTMPSEEAFKMIDFGDVLKLRHDVLPNTKDSIQNNKSFITAFIASVDVADFMINLIYSKYKNSSRSN